MHSTKMFLLIVGYFWINLYLVLGSHMLGAPFGVQWICNLVPSTGAVSALVWLVWVVGICGVHFSRILPLRCPVVMICNTTSVLFRSIGPLSSLWLPHIFLGVLRWGGPRPFYSYTWSKNYLPLGWNLYPFIGVSIVLGCFFPLHSHKFLGFPWAIHELWYLFAPGHTFHFRIWHICIHRFDFCSGYICLWSIGVVVWFIYCNIRPS